MVINCNKDKNRKIRSKYRVIADGKDVTARVNYVDGRRRILRLFKVNEHGQFYVDVTTMETADEWIRPRRLRLVKKA